MIERLLPDRIVVSECRVGSARGQLTPEEELCVRSAVPKRRREFLAGRWCARAALGGLGLPHATLPSNPDRTPAWPAGVVGSITHSDSFCAAAAALDADFASVGIDIEEAGRFDLKLLPHVCTARELDALSALPPTERLRTGALIFSAKESFYKCQYTLTHRWLGFHSVEIDLDPPRGEFRVSLLPGHGADVPRSGFVCKYASDGAVVATAVFIARRPIEI